MGEEKEKVRRIRGGGRGKEWRNSFIRGKCETGSVRDYLHFH